MVRKSQVNRRSFINRLFLFTGALSSGLWIPKPKWQLVPFWWNQQCITRVVSWGYLEGILGRKLPFEEAKQMAHDRNAIFLIDRPMCEMPSSEELTRLFSKANGSDLAFSENWKI